MSQHEKKVTYHVRLVVDRMDFERCEVTGELVLIDQAEVSSEMVAVATEEADALAKAANALGAVHV